MPEQQHADPLGDLRRGLAQPGDQVEAACQQVAGDHVGQLAGAVVDDVRLADGLGDQERQVGAAVVEDGGGHRHGVAVGGLGRGEVVAHLDGLGYLLQRGSVR
ncbi:hypothetical protein [Streptomyces sp. NPDC001056]